MDSYKSTLIEKERVYAYINWNFLVENGDKSSVSLFVGMAIFLTTSLLFVAFLKRQQLICAWNNIRESLIDKVNAEGLKATNILIEIAMTSAEGETGKKIGMILQQVIDTKDKPNFYTKVLKFMEGINDNSQMEKLNGDYARVRNSIESAIKLIEVVPRAAMLGRNDLSRVRVLVNKNVDDPFVDNGFLTDFFILAEAVIDVEKNIARAIARIEKIISDFKSQEIIVEEELVPASADSGTK